MIKNKRDIIIQLIASVILIVTVYLPTDSYIVKGVGLILFNTVLFKDDIKTILTKGNKKDVFILLIGLVIFCLAILLPNLIWIIRVLGIIIFNVILVRSLQYKTNKKGTNDSK